VKMYTTYSRINVYCEVRYNVTRRWSVAGVGSDRLAIQSRGEINVLLSAQHLLSCIGRHQGQNGCHPNGIDRAWWFIRRVGSVSLSSSFTNRSDNLITTREELRASSLLCEHLLPDNPIPAMDVSPAHFCRHIIGHFSLLPVCHCANLGPYCPNAFRLSRWVLIFLNRQVIVDKTQRPRIVWKLF